jgi:hypothetical protein
MLTSKQEKTKKVLWKNSSIFGHTKSFPIDCVKEKFAHCLILFHIEKFPI